MVTGWVTGAWQAVVGSGVGEGCAGNLPSARLAVRLKGAPQRYRAPAIGPRVNEYAQAELSDVRTPPDLLNVIRAA